MDLTPGTGWSDHQPEEITVECGCGDVCGMDCKGDGREVICPVEDIEWPCEVVVAYRAGQEDAARYEHDVLMTMLSREIELPGLEDAHRHQAATEIRKQITERAVGVAKERAEAMAREMMATEHREDDE